MNADILLKHFDRISDAPDAVARLRRFILDLAVRGKLVEQDPDDEPAAELLKRIQAEKARLVKEGKIRKQKPLRPIGEDELPTSRHSTWQWARLGNLSTLVTKGSTPTSYGHPYTESGINFIKVESIKKGRLNSEYITSFIAEETHRFLGRSQLEAGDVLFSIAGSIGTCAIVNEDILPANTNQALAIIRGTKLVYAPEFLLSCIQSSVAQVILDKARGGAMNNVSLEDIQNFVVPLPPLAEQHRIVAKVDELMALCDQLESARNEREAQRDRLVAASLHRIGTAPAVEGEDQEDAQTVTSLPAAARFHLDHLPRLTTRVEHIKQLRQAILNLAVRGRLVPQDPKDEPASELLKRIQVEKARLVKDGLIRKQPSLLAVDSVSIPFAVPQHWRWLPLCGIGVLSGGMTPSKSRSEYWDGSINWFSPKDIKSEELSNSELKISSIGLSETNLHLYPTGCLFFVARSGILKRTFPVAINRIEATVNQDLKVLTPFLQGMERYLQIMFRGMTEYILKALVKTGTTVQSLKYEEFEIQAVPLPPLAEQHRIVAKVDELMALCDQLEAQLTTTETDSRRLLEAVLQDALGNSDVGQQMQPLRSLSQTKTSAGKASMIQKVGVESCSNIPMIDQVEHKPLAASRNIPSAILAHLNPGREYSRAEILTAIELSEADWAWAIRQLKAEGRVVQKGEKRGAKYLLV